MIRRFREMGVSLVASTDAGMTQTPFDDLPNLLVFLIEAVGMDATEAIHSVTGRAAAAIRHADRLGTIGPGRVADLRLVRGNPDDGDPAALRDVVGVLREGRIVPLEPDGVRG